MKNFFLLLITLITSLFPASLYANIEVKEMRVNNLSTPLPIDVSPVFGWKLSSTERGTSQSAYQIIVTNADGTELWNSGKITGSRTSSIKYEGQALSSSTTYNWKVKVWDQAGSESSWSTSTFETALLNESDWKAKWISYNQKIPQYAITLKTTTTLRYLNIIVTTLGLPVNGEDGKYRLQLAEVEVMSGGKNVAKGCTASISPEETYQSMWKASNLTDGIIFGGSQVGATTTAFTSAKPSSIPTVKIDLGQDYPVDQIILYPRNDASAQSNNDLCANFPVDFRISTRASSSSTYSLLCNPSGVPAPTFMKRDEVPVFGKNFSVTKDIKRARAYASGLGTFEMRVNGKRVTDNVLEPGETDYTKTVLYATYDITDKLVKGDNTVLSFVAGALYDNPANNKYSKFNRIYGPQRFIAQIQIDYTDGTSDTIVTNDDWKLTTGATTFSSWYGGEDYDANLYDASMFKAGYSVAGWKEAGLCNIDAGKLKAQFYPPTAVVKKWNAASISSPKSGVYVIDFGQNFAGQYEFTLTQPANTVIKLYPTERLNTSGEADQSATGSPRYDTYTFSGNSAGETWGPNFMYHGFRYLVVYGLTSAPTANMFTAKQIRSAVEQTGSVETSNTLLNSIHKLIVAATEANLYNTLTDCPHREKLGWLEVPQLMFNSISYNFDMASWWPKIALDTHDAQYDSGYVPNVAPHHVTFSEYWDNDPSWGGSTILVPYRSYKFYGDKASIETAYPTMAKLMSYYKTRSSNNLISINCLGDWGCYDKTTTVAYTINCTYYALAKAMEECAQVLGNTTDESYYKQLAADIRTAINTKYFKSGIYDAGSQADYAMALYYGIVEDANRAAVIDKLLAKVKASDYHLTTGEVALKPLFMSLSENGYNDVVYTMATKTDMPSYGYFIQQGATTLPEFWDMKESLDHCMMGHLEEWFYSGLGGIKNNSIGFNDFKIEPYFSKDLDWANVSTDCGSGTISVSWKRSGNNISADFEVPTNTTAEIILPSNKYKIITENGADIAVGNGIKSITKDSVSSHICVGSGKYSFVVTDNTPESVNDVKDDLDLVLRHADGGVYVSTPTPAMLHVYSLDGTLIKVEQLNRKSTFVSLKKGCYIFNNVKVNI